MRAGNSRMTLNKSAKEFVHGSAWNTDALVLYSEGYVDRIGALVERPTQSDRRFYVSLRQRSELERVRQDVEQALSEAMRIPKKRPHWVCIYRVLDDQLDRLGLSDMPNSHGSGFDDTSEIEVDAFRLNRTRIQLGPVQHRSHNALQVVRRSTDD